MTTTNLTDDIATLQGREVYDRNGDKVGSVGQIYADHAGRPTWASVNTGLFGMNESMVPLHEASVEGDRLRVPYEKGMVKDAPNVDSAADEPLTSGEVERLYQHYDLGWDTESTGQHAAGYAAGAAAYQDRARDTSGRGGDAMTRSEERLNVDTEAQRAGVARLRKYVVTENVQTTVPVQREEVRLEREPVTEANRDAAYSGPDITESEHEVTLYAEQPVVSKETVPVERVRLGKETVTDQQAVGGEVRKERIEADLPDENGRRRLD